jgi:hypothetical protein
LRHKRSPQIELDEFAGLSRVRRANRLVLVQPCGKNTEKPGIL